MNRTPSLDTSNMNKLPLVAVVTTIQPPTQSIRQLSSVLGSKGCPLIVVGDEKGPFEYDLAGAQFLTFKEQSALPYRLVSLLPKGHYARKNIGYLAAFEQGASCIYEIDDDNAPLPSWRRRSRVTEARPVMTSGWFNVYRVFSDEIIWPRGFLLELCRQPLLGDSLSRKTTPVDSPIQLGLSNGSPDVDAIWRLVGDKPITFRDEPSVFLGREAWCPFNSQSTWWWPAAYPLMYLPSHCSFRMTDIWRSFVAQRCLWELNTGLVFHAAEVVQTRNAHNLLKNFEDEIVGYLRNGEIVRTLAELSLQPGIAAVGDNLQKCYEQLVAHGFFPVDELSLVRAWLDDIQNFYGGDVVAR